MIAYRALFLKGDHLSYKNQVKLQFVLSHADQDERPYLNVDILGEKFLGLFDSGASRTIVGNTGWKALSRMGMSLKRRSIVCTVANGEKVRILGEAYVAVKVQETTCCRDACCTGHILSTQSRYRLLSDHGGSTGSSE